MEHAKNTGESQDILDSVHLSSRAVGLLASGFLLTVFFTFMSGYFIGKRVAVSEFVDIVEHETLQAKVHDAVLSMYHQYTLPEPIKALDEQKDSDLPSCSSQDHGQPCALAEATQSEREANNDEIVYDDKKIDTIDTQVSSQEGSFVAQLASFRLQSEARAMTKRLSLRGIDSLIKKRTSHAIGNKQKVIWYQVVTKPHHDKKALEALAQTLEKEEKLRGIFIYSC